MWADYSQKDLIKKIADVDPNLRTQKDEEEWKFIHEALAYIFFTDALERWGIPELFSELNHEQQKNFIKHFEAFRSIALRYGWLSDYERIVEMTKASMSKNVFKGFLVSIIGLVTICLLLKHLSFENMHLYSLLALLIYGVFSFMEKVFKNLQSIKEQNDYKFGKLFPEVLTKEVKLACEENLKAAGWLKPWHY
jgi:hypothetical protein